MFFGVLTRRDARVKKDGNGQMFGSKRLPLFRTGSTFEPEPVLQL